MRKDVKKQELTYDQLTILSVNTCQWWNAVIFQATRFFDILESSHGGTPWDDDNSNSVFVAERLFLIIAIYHAIENLQKLDIELHRIGDGTMTAVLCAIEQISTFEDIKNLRDMNVHGLDYLANVGKNQAKFKTCVEYNNHLFYTTAAWTYVHGDAGVVLMGNVPIDKLVLVMKEQLPVVRTKTKEVFDKTLFGK